MKVTSKSIAEFKPIELTLTIETAEEAKALYAIFNKASNSELLGWGECQNIMASIGSTYYISGGIIANGISYKHFYNGDK